MCEREKRRKSFPAQVTVYGAITIGLVIALIVTLIKASYDAASVAQINAAVNLSKEAMFSNYSNKLLDKYSIFAMKKDETLNEKLSGYVKDNLSGNENITFESAELREFSMMTDNGGDNIRKEILAYMQYGVFSEIIDSLNDSQKEMQKSEKVSEISESIAECQEEQIKHNREQLRILEFVEGIKTTDSGIVIRSSKPVRTDGYAVKAFLRGGPDMTSAAVGNEKVFNVLNNSGMYINIPETIQGMKDSESDTYCREKLNLLKGIAGEISRKCSEARSCCERFMEGNKGTDIKIKECSAMIENGKETIGDELYQSFSSDIETMEAPDEEYSFCDVEKLYQLLAIKQAETDSLQDAIGAALQKEKWEDMYDELDNMFLISNEISNAGLRFDYSKVDFSGESEGIGGISDIKDKLSDGLLGLVLDGKDVSKKAVEYGDLASSIAGSGNETVGAGGDIAKEALAGEYIMTKFNSFQKPSEGLLDYEIEYILSGNNSDRKNLEDVVLKLSIFREGINLTSLLTDSAKRNEALMMATTLLGFTGNYAIIKAGQYLIMTLWAYAESIMDLRDIFDGKKALIIKGRDDWHLSLENAIAMNFKGSDKKTEGVSATDYEGHLRLLLLTENCEKKYFRTMGAMELYMINAGEKVFRMRNYIFSSEGTGIFKTVFSQNIYNIDIGYSYG